MTAAVRPLPPSTIGFWRGYWTTLRPYLFFVSGASGLVGLALAPGLGGVGLTAAAFAFFLAYGLGQALTDVTQVDTDSISSPYRPLVRGEIAGRDVFAVSLLGLALCAAVFGSLNPYTLPVCALAVVGLATYTYFKRRWWGGPVWNSWIVALLPVIGILCGGDAPPTALADPALRWATASVFSSYAIFVILGYFKDVEADRATGYVTLPVRFGRKIAAAVSAAFLCVAATASFLLLTTRNAFSAIAGLDAGCGFLLWASGLGLLAWAHVRILPTTRDDEAHPAVSFVVTGYVALHLGEAALLRPELAGVCVAVLLVSILFLRWRPCRSQV